MSNILLVFSYVPEECHIYLLRNVSEEEADILKTADGKYINCHEPTQGLNVLSYALITEFVDGQIPDIHLDGMKELGVDPSWFAKYKDCKLDGLPDLSDVPITTVINTGFYL